jgi:hypothetical protein
MSPIKYEMYRNKIKDHSKLSKENVYFCVNSFGNPDYMESDEIKDGIGKLTGTYELKFKIRFISGEMELTAKDTKIYERDIKKIYFPETDEKLLNPSTGETKNIANLDESIFVVFGCFMFIDGKWAEVPVYINLYNECFICGGKKINFSKCYIGTIKHVIGDEHYEINMNQMIKHMGFSKLNHIERNIQMVLDEVEIDLTKILECENLYEDNYSSFTKIRFIDEKEKETEILIPNYYYPFFGKYSPIFQKSFPNGAYNNNVQSFKIVFSWLIHIFNKKQFPDSKEIINKLNVMKHIKETIDFFNIEIIEKLVIELAKIETD